MRAVLFVYGKQGSGKSRLARELIKLMAKAKFWPMPIVYTTNDRALFERVSNELQEANREEL